MLRGLELGFQPGHLSRASARMARCAQLVQGFVQLEDFFEKFRRRLLLVLAFPAHPGESQQILHPAHRIAQRAVGIVQLRGAYQRELPLGLRGALEVIGMQLPGERMEFLLELRRVEGELLRQAEEREVVGATRQRLDLSARRAELRAAGRRRAIPARCWCRRSGRCAHYWIPIPKPSPRTLSYRRRLAGIVALLEVPEGASETLALRKRRVLPRRAKKMAGGIPLPANHAFRPPRDEGLALSSERESSITL